LLIIKLKSFEEEALAKYNNSSLENLINWFVRYALQYSSQSLPRSSLFAAIDSILQRDKEGRQKLFEDEKTVCELLEKTK
jgi:hypothetical protein